MIKWILTSFLIIASIFVSLLCGSASYAATLPDMPTANFSDLKQTESARVVEIIDPLTVRLDNGTLVNLTGLDYPDLDYYLPGNFSIMTLKIMKDFLLDQPVILYQSKDEENGRVNRMGHAIAHLVRKDDKIWVQGLMLTLGLARARTTKTNPEMAEQMYVMEATAREAKTGIWAVKGYQILSASTSNAGIGGFQIVEGEIQKIAMQKNRLFLNFGKDWKTDFTVSISPMNKKLFTKEDLDPQKWQGKTVRVRGWVESFNGPFIEVDHPAQFELLFSPQDIAKEEAPAAVTTPTESKEVEKPAENKGIRKTIIKRAPESPYPKELPASAQSE